MNHVSQASLESSDENPFPWAVLVHVSPERHKKDVVDGRINSSSVVTRNSDRAANCSPVGWSDSSATSWHVCTEAAQWTYGALTNTYYPRAEVYSFLAVWVFIKRSSSRTGGQDSYTSSIHFSKNYLYNKCNRHFAEAAVDAADPVFATHLFIDLIPFK